VVHAGTPGPVNLSLAAELVALLATRSLHESFRSRSLPLLIYANSAARARFKADPYDEAKRAGFSDNECAALLTAARRPLYQVSFSMT